VSSGLSVVVTLPLKALLGAVWVLKFGASLEFATWSLDSSAIAFVDVSGDRFD
jgi:hypothetical protein